jgi:hypothetical protein
MISQRAWPPYFSGPLLMSESFAKSLKFFIILLFLTFHSENSLAANQVDFEWEVIEGAKLYQVEIKNNKGEIQPLKSKNAAFSVSMSPGKYLIHGRVSDDNNQVSPWSPWKGFDIPPGKIKIIEHPQKEMKIGNNSYLSSVPVSWAPVDGAHNYSVAIIDATGKVMISSVVKNPRIRLQLRPGLYSVRIKARTLDELESEPFQSSEPFLVQNIPVEPPTNVILDDTKNTLTFGSAPGTSIIAKLEMQYFLSENWQTINRKIKATSSLDWLKNLKPGKYRITLISQNAFGEVSTPIIKEFIRKPSDGVLPD